jgi:predicted adenylyl cyclase CyaB
MPSNIEIKARVADPARKRELAERLAQTPPGVLKQHDTFFPCANGRLKLREFSRTEGELIFYRRPDTAGPKQSEYLLSATSSPASLLGLLTSAYGIEKVVNKTRLVYLAGQTRIHLDSVVDLGSFVEIEVVLNEGQSTDEGRRLAEQFMVALEIDPADLIECSYADLLDA